MQSFKNKHNCLWNKPSLFPGSVATPGKIRTGRWRLAFSSSIFKSDYFPVRPYFQENIVVRILVDLDCGRSNQKIMIISVTYEGGRFIIFPFFLFENLL